MDLNLAGHSFELLELLALNLQSLLEPVIILDAHALAQVVVCDARISDLDRLGPVHMVVLLSTIGSASLALESANFFVHLVTLLHHRRFD